MAEQLISIGYGRETFSTCSASLSAFVVETGFTRTLPSKKFRRQGMLQKFPVSAHPEINGYLFLDSVMNVPDGTLILLQSSHRHLGAPLRDGGVFICMRSTAAMLSVKANLPSAQESTLTGDFLVFQGRGDVLTAKEVNAQGIDVPKNYLKGFLDAEEVRECYTITVTSPQIQEKPRLETVKDVDGETVLIRQRPTRKVSLRRPA